MLSFGSSSDFLLAFVLARQQKAKLASTLPLSTLRVQLFYPNGQRVSKHDIRATLSALADQRISVAVSARLVASADVPPAAQARTERTAHATSNCDGAPQSVFCQAGVVAPPDSLTGETSTAINFIEVCA